MKIWTPKNRTREGEKQERAGGNKGKKKMLKPLREKGFEGAKNTTRTNLKPS